MQIDPRTNRVTVFPRGGAAVQLWDGTHRLQDGTVIITRSGVVVPNREILEMRRGIPGDPKPPEPSARIPRCEMLARKVCGARGECTDSPTCAPARQLMESQRDLDRGVASVRWHDRDLLATQCEEALQDEAFFTPCERMEPSATACAPLVNRVCGPADECGGAPACAPARQLLAREIRERHLSGDPDTPTHTSGDCRQALDDTAFFRACRPRGR